MANSFHMTPEELRRFRENGFAGPFDLYDSEAIKRDYREIRAQLFDRGHAV